MDLGESKQQQRESVQRISQRQSPHATPVTPVTPVTPDNTFRASTRFTNN